MENCWVCETTEKPILDDNLCFALLDAGPVNPGHSLVVPKRHIENIFDATDDEILAMIRMLKKLFKDIQEKDPSVVAYNIGVNCGLAAGQTTKHLHIHLIPRYEGDTKNPIGGVRGVIPDKMHEVAL